jgi:septum formation protein
MPNAPAPLILACTSIYRRSLLERLQIPFQSVAPDTDEMPHAAEAPDALVRRLSVAKAEAVGRMHPDAVIIGGDQAAVGPDGAILGKPGTIDRACSQLMRLSGQPVRFLSGLCLLDARSGESQVDVITTTVRFRILDEVSIRRYVERDRPLDCAGALRSEALGIALCDAIDSNDPTALLGLPLIRLAAMLRSAGYTLP